MKSLTLLSLLFCLTCTDVAQAEQTVLTFDKALDKKWSKQFGDWKVENGTLKVSQVEADKHVAAFRYAHPLTDAKISVDFQFEGAEVFHLGFDPARGELDKKGHLFSVVVTPRGLMLQKSRDKAKPASKNENLAELNLDLQPTDVNTLTVTLKGEDVTVELKSISPMRTRTAEATVKDAEFAVKKPGLVFRVGGTDGTGVLIKKVIIEN